MSLLAFTIVPVPAEVVRPLRHAVLRSHQPFDAVRYPGDDDPGTAHFAAYDDTGRMVGTASAYDEGAGTWRLRGMTTVEEVRGRGAGARLLAAVVDHATAYGGTLIWCNARTTAVGFYERYGWVKVSDEFDDPDAGPHYRMTRSLAGPPTAR